MYRSSSIITVAVSIHFMYSMIRGIRRPQECTDHERPPYSHCHSRETVSISRKLGSIDWMRAAHLFGCPSSITRHNSSRLVNRLRRISPDSAIDSRSWPCPNRKTQYRQRSTVGARYNAGPPQLSTTFLHLQGAAVRSASKRSTLNDRTGGGSSSIAPRLTTTRRVVSAGKTPGRKFVKCSARTLST